MTVSPENLMMIQRNDLMMMIIMIMKIIIIIIITTQWGEISLVAKMMFLDLSLICNKIELRLVITGSRTNACLHETDKVSPFLTNDISILIF